MPKYNRIFTIVIDSLGTGAMPDSEKFGDVGVDTLGHIAEHMKGFHIPNLQKLGIANLRPLKGVAPVEKPTGRFTKFSEASNGKDTMTRSRFPEGADRRAGKTHRTQSNRK